MPDSIAAALDEIRERNERRIEFHRYTEYTVAHDVAEGDVRRLLAALDEVLKLASGWEVNSAAVPYLNREAAGLAVQAIIRAALLGGT